MKDMACEVSHKVLKKGCDVTHSAIAMGARSGSSSGHPVLFRVMTRNENDFNSKLGHAIQTGDTEQLQGSGQSVSYLPLLVQLAALLLLHFCLVKFFRGCAVGPSTGC